MGKFQIGAVFPQTEIGADPIALRDYAQAVEEMGFDYLVAFDHVVGAEVSSRPDWRPLRGGPPAYSHESMFHEPFVLFGYLAGLTKRLHFATGVLILGQRQTVLVAKQAAEVDVLTGGRLRLAVGNGWNDVEYEALGMNFHDRGRRIEEQVEVMRALWTSPLVDFKGKWHRVDRAGINPLPIQRPIPVWFGGLAPAVADRIGRIGDGWYVNGPLETARPFIERMRNTAAAAGRDASKLGIQVVMFHGNKAPEDRARDITPWLDIGATHIDYNTMRAGFSTLEQHIDALRRFKLAMPQ